MAPCLWCDKRPGVTKNSSEIAWRISGPMLPLVLHTELFIYHSPSLLLLCVILFILFIVLCHVVHQDSRATPSNSTTRWTQWRKRSRRQVHIFLLLLFSCFFGDKARRTQWQIRCAGKCRLFFFYTGPRRQDAAGEQLAIYVFSHYEYGLTKLN